MIVIVFVLFFVSVEDECGLSPVVPSFVPSQVSGSSCLSSPLSPRVLIHRPPIQWYHPTYGECQALNSKKIVNFAFTLPPLLPHGGEESLVADISSIILQDYDKCQTPLKDDSPECPQTSNVFPCRVFLYFRCLCIIFVEQTIGTASLSPHTTPTNKKEGT